MKSVPKNSDVLAYSKCQGLLSFLLTVTLSPIQEVQPRISAFLSDKSFSSISSFSTLRGAAAAAKVYGHSFAACPLLQHHVHYYATVQIQL